MQCLERATSGLIIDTVCKKSADLGNSSLKQACSLDEKGVLSEISQNLPYCIRPFVSASKHRILIFEWRFIKKKLN